MEEKEDCIKNLINRGKENGKYIEGNVEVLGYTESMLVLTKALVNALPLSNASKKNILRKCFLEYEGNEKKEEPENKGESHGGN